MGFDAIVLAGGGGRRLGGADKAEIVVGGERLIDRALEAVAAAGETVVVGPRRWTSRPVAWTRERPPGGGPVPAVAAGLSRVGEAEVVLLAVDMPFVDADVVTAMVRRLEAGDEIFDGVVLLDPSGRAQPLAAVYRSERLRAALPRSEGLAGAELRRVTGSLKLVELPAGRAGLDCDTWEDVKSARLEIEGGRDGRLDRRGLRRAGN